MNNKKYELIKKDSIRITLNDKTKSTSVRLYRIRSLRNFSDVKKGDLGGYIQSEDNLSHEGNCWVYDNAKAYEDAKLFDDSKIFDKVRVFGCAHLHDNDVIIRGNAKICGHAIISNNVTIDGDVIICGNALITQGVEMTGDITINEGGYISNNVKICGHVFCYKFINIGCNTIMNIIENNYLIIEHSIKIKNGYIESNGDILYIDGIGNGYDTIIAYRDRRNKVRINHDYCDGPLKILKKISKKKHGGNKYNKEYNLLISLIKNHFKKN